MVRGIRQLRDTEIVRPDLGAFIDAGVEIDEMPSGFAGGLHDQLNVALAVERAGVPDIAVVIDYMDNVGSFAPADSLQMNSERRAGRAVGLIQKLPVCLPRVDSTLSVCEPPRSSGTLKRNSARP